MNITNVRVVFSFFFFVLSPNEQNVHENKASIGNELHCEEDNDSRIDKTNT